ncbi:MAG TPA: response regulator [Desulfuromonadaceae bacterium]|jgi:YesN/AraC family two-component response regulator
MIFPEKLTVLIAEDDDKSLELLSSILALNFPNLVFHSARNGRAGVEIFKKHLPDIIITDFNMPEMDGIQMIGEIQSIKPDVMTILVTAYGDKTIQEATASAGLEIEHHLLKPINFKELFAIVNQCVTSINDLRELHPLPI